MSSNQNRSTSSAEMSLVSPAVTTHSNHFNKKKRYRVYFLGLERTARRRVCRSILCDSVERASIMHDASTDKRED